MIYAVIDTNVVVSALITKHRDSSTVKVLKAVLEGKAVPVLNNDILKEYDAVLRIISPADFAKLLDSINLQ